MIFIFALILLAALVYAKSPQYDRADAVAFTLVIGGMIALMSAAIVGSALELGSTNIQKRYALDSNSRVIESEYYYTIVTDQDNFVLDKDYVTVETGDGVLIKNDRRQNYLWGFFGVENDYVLQIPDDGTIDRRG